MEEVWLQKNKKDSCGALEMYVFTIMVVVVGDCMSFVSVKTVNTGHNIVLFALFMLYIIKLSSNYDPISESLMILISNVLHTILNNLYEKQPYVGQHFSEGQIIYTILVPKTVSHRDTAVILVL